MLRYGEVSAIRRCATQPIPSHHNHHEEVEDGSPPTTIAERLAALQKRGQSDWKKRVAKPNPEEDLLPQGRVLAERVGRLETASQGWKARVAPGDAKQFTVAARMSPSPTPTPSLGVTSRTPAPVVFQPILPQLPPTQLLRSISAPGKEIKDLNLNGSDEVQGPLISVPDICGAEVSAFFSKPLDKLECSEFQEFDLEVLPSNTSQLLVQKKKIKVKRKHLSANPLKALAQRSDLCTEYIEVRSGIAERDRRRINLDKLARSSGLALEALAGLASKEDIKAISLRKAGESPPPSAVSQWPHPLLLRVKGRRHPITTVVKPHYSSVNQGDTFILITQNNVFLWIGEYSNVIEKSRGGEIALEVQSRRDLGCIGAPQVVTLGGTEHSEMHSQFWEMLGLPSQMVHTYQGESAGHPDEDEVYEAAIAETYTVYSLTEGLLCPVQTYWGRLPKVDIFDPMKVLVFDFNYEVYVWGGKTTTLFDKKLAFQLAKELFKTRHFKWHPTGIAWLDSDLEMEARSPWSVLCKITQHMEPVLFREKFVDWPSADISSISYIDRQVEAGLIVHPCNTDEMLNWSPSPPDLVLEGTNIGRGRTFFDTETRRHFEVMTLGLKIWRVEDYTTVEVEEASVGQFNDKESYILRWEYRVTVSGRELNGEISKHGKQVGRERVTRWVWQGREAEALEQGAAALLATEEVAGVTVVRSGAEPPALLAALPGPLVVHWSTPQSSSSLLFVITGDVESEAVLRQVEPTWPSLRSKASAFFISHTSNRAYLWHGAKAQPNTKQVAIVAVNYLRDTQPPELGLGLGVVLNFEQIEEGEEPHDFLDGVSDRESYGSLLEKENYENWSPRMFHLSSVVGEFRATPFLSTSFHPDYDTPFPYTQDDLYSTNRPGLVLVDGGSELWLWQGWSSEVEGTMGVRYQAERRAAMTTALQYWHRRSRPSHSVFLVWAGLEPPAFKALFPTWSHNQVAAQANLSEGRKHNEVKGVQEELASLNKCTYPPSALMQHPLPAGVDPTRLELYLDPVHFKELLGISHEEFNSLPFWKKEKLKKKAGLF